MAKKIKNKSYITYRKKEDKEENHWFVITWSKNNRKTVFSFSSENEAINGWKNHVENNLVVQNLKEDQKFFALVKNTDGRWSFQMIYTHDSKNKKSIVVKEELKPKDGKKASKVEKKHNKASSKPKKTTTAKTKNEEMTNNQEESQPVDKRWFNLHKGWVLFGILVLAVGLGLSIAALIIIYQ